MLVGDRSSPPGTQKEDLFLDNVFSYSFQQDELSHITAWAREEQHVKYSSFWGQMRSKCLQSWEPRALRLQPWASSGRCCLLSRPNRAGSAGAVKNEVGSRALVGLASLLTFGSEILFFKSFLGAEWKTLRGFGGAFLVTVC